MREARSLAVIFSSSHSLSIVHFNFYWEAKGRPSATGVVSLYHRVSAYTVLTAYIPGYILHLLIAPAVTSIVSIYLLD